MRGTSSPNPPSATMRTTHRLRPERQNAWLTPEGDARLPQSEQDNPQRREDQRHDPDSGGDEDDLTTQIPKRPVRLKGDDVQTRITKDTMAASGGIRNPPHAFSRLKKHQAVGQLALQAIMQSLADDDTIEGLVLEAIGDSTKTHLGPTDEQVAKARRSLYHSLNLSYSQRRAGLTQLEPDLYDQWVAVSEDFDIDVHTWLRSGTPYGD